MRNWTALGMGALIAAGIAFALPASAQTKSLQADKRLPSGQLIVPISSQAVVNTSVAHVGKPQPAVRQVYAGISCVPFVRNETGMAVSGNANKWWDNASGLYARGQSPERGSVMAFRANPRMRLGHVAMVTKIVNDREVEIDHANWAGPGGRKGSVSRGVRVVDVSDRNDWTAVRVELGRGGDFGSVYPTYGFIYDRPDNGTILTAMNNPNSKLRPMNPPPRDLRPVAERTPMPSSIGFDEVAEAPESRGWRMRVSTETTAR